MGESGRTKYIGYTRYIELLTKLTDCYHKMDDLRFAVEVYDKITDDNRIDLEFYFKKHDELLLEAVKLTNDMLEEYVNTVTR